MSADNKISVLIIDDSAFMRKMIADLLERDKRIRVVEKARNGRDGIEKIKKYKPDVVTLDVEMPVMNGLDALKKIMKETPLPVIMVSSTTKKGADNTLEAMSLGAFDFITKPSGAISLDIHKVQNELIEKVTAASNARPVQVRSHENQRHPVIRKRQPPVTLVRTKIVAIGTSTGGPRALQTVLGNIPRDFPYPILVVQHMPPGFTKSLSERLDGQAQIKVKEAEHGEIIKRGIAYIAPGGYHLKVKKLGSSVVVHLDDESDTVNGHRPSVDVMLTSLATLPKTRVISVILTGMGSDGTEGIKSLKRNSDVYVITESEETAVVYGMPRAVVESGLSDAVTNLDHITNELGQH
ncbi:protein-glutamate methylesterase/protein-glutamine glutaminase [Alteribacter keqinensis]|uniref:Protein-glutamate methylesterase/protein-glutamine glutaminase n=1 Tax=Alteribacter keqinensis TaxID=2483800 RepID=A0A3M7TYS2_9BACI|nr:chemotaxis response regulator protein-glutamate methylesterase [Alteribacter keqinensis]RNA69575.1 chemotaxis response regulator protein-glutamate methylesterase [Alteribacter keqinensis]